MKLFKNLSIFYSYFLFSIIILVPLYIFNVDIDNMSNELYYAFLFGMDFIFVFILWFMYKKDLKEKLGDLKKNLKKYLPLMIKGWGIGLLLMVISNVVISYIIPIDVPENEVLIKKMFEIVPVYIFWSTIIYAPFVEEIIFRHSIRKVITSKWLYIVISGLVFGLTHVIYSAESFASLIYFIPYAFIGWGLAWVYTKTDNIYTTIIMHVVHNSILVGLLFIRTMVI